MIKDVKIKYIKSYYDDRGFFAEVIKEGEETYHPIKQTSYTETNPGIIKAFHYHNKQDETWFVVKGSAKAVLIDPQTKETMVLYPNESNKMLIYIPKGVIHGYQVLGNKTFGMFYHTSEAYDPSNPDEQRIPFDELFDWTIHNK